MNKCKHEHGFIIDRDEEGEPINAWCKDCDMNVI